jgi:glycosyltransferase involved in cell wall biosynthesis
VVRRVLAINRVGFVGGVERVVLNCALSVRKHNFSTMVACPAPGALAEEAAREGMVVIPVRIDRSKASVSPRQWLRLGGALRVGGQDILEIAKRNAIDLLHAHHPIGALYALKAARRLRLPLLWHVHETLPLPPLYGFVARWVMPHCALFICVSEAGCALMRWLGAPEEKIRLIYNSVDARFLASPQPAAALHRDRVGRGPHIGLFGVLEPRKGQEDFIRAAAVIKDRYPQAQFWVVGGVSFAENAAYLERLRQLAQQSGLMGRVHFPGHCRDVPQWMAGMDMVVLASRGRESLPTVLIEAAVLGKRLVATDVGGVREIVRDGRTGAVVAAGDVSALAVAMDRMLEPAGGVMAERAGRDARRRFAPERFSQQMCEVYGALLGMAPAPAGQAA